MLFLLSKTIKTLRPLCRQIRTGEEYKLPEKLRHDRIIVNFMKREWQDMPDDFHLKQDLYKRERKLNKQIKRWRKKHLNIDDSFIQD